jgi:hypothetical protein
MSLELFFFKLKYKTKNFFLEKQKTMKLQKERKNLLKSTKHVLLQYFLNKIKMYASLLVYRMFLKSFNSFSITIQISD